MSDDRRRPDSTDFDPAEQEVRRRFARFVEELDNAASLAADLLDEPEVGRGNLLRQTRFQGLALCELLLERSREAWAAEPARALELSALGVEVSGRLDVSLYGDELVEDARARAWAHLANARRIASDLRQAEEALVTARGHHRRAGSDAFTEAEILSFEASLRSSQGRFDEAARLLDGALAIYRQARDRHRVASHSPEITISNVGLDLEELLAVVETLDEPSRARVARVLVKVEMDARLKELIEQLAARAPADVSDADIDCEVQAVRNAARPA